MKLASLVALSTHMFTVSLVILTIHHLKYDLTQAHFCKEEPFICTNVLVTN